MESVQGKVNNAMNEIGQQLSPDFVRYWQELGDIRKARYEEKQLKGKKKKVFFDDKRGKLKDLIRDEKDGLEHALKAVEFFYELIRNLAYDMHTIKEIIKELHHENKELARRGIPHQIEHHLDSEVMKTVNRVNDRLRKGSDMLGALTKA